MGFSRQEYWSGLPFPIPGNLPNPGVKPKSPALAGGFFTTESIVQTLFSDGGKIQIVTEPPTGAWAKVSAQDAARHSQKPANHPHEQNWGSVQTLHTGIMCLLYLAAGSPGGSAGKESVCSAGDPGLTPGSGRSPGEGNGHPLQCSCLVHGESHGQRSLAGYSPWGHKESNTTD